MYVCMYVCMYVYVYTYIYIYYTIYIYISAGSWEPGRARALPVITVTFPVVAIAVLRGATSNQIVETMLKIGTCAIHGTDTYAVYIHHGGTWHVLIIDVHCYDMRIPSTSLHDMSCIVLCS